MKKKIFISVAGIVLLCGGFAVAKKSSTSVITPLQAENIEALSAIESVRIPCVQDYDNQCTFKATDALGQGGKVILRDMRLVLP